MIEKIYEKYLNEVKVSPANKKEFEKYAIEISKNIMKVSKKETYHFSDGYEDHIRNVVHSVMMNMALPKDNPNYKATEKYMPKNFNKDLFDNGDGNVYNSVWMSMTDAQQFTIVKKATKNL